MPALSTPLLSPSPPPGSYLEAVYKCYHLQKWARISHSFLGAKLGSELQSRHPEHTGHRTAVDGGGGQRRRTQAEDGGGGPRLWTEAVDGGGGRRRRTEAWPEAEDGGCAWRRRREPGCPVALCAVVTVASATRLRPPGWLVQTRVGSRCRVHASAPRSELAQWQPLAGITFPLDSAGLAVEHIVRGSRAPLSIP